MSEQQITLEPMAPEHLNGAVELSGQVGWPHRREDWELVHSLSQGVVVVEQGRVVATTLLTPYGEGAANINMVIVDASMRGRGLGRTLMEWTLAKAGERSCHLVATLEGLPLYEKLGFVATGKIMQHQGEALLVDAPDRVSWSDASDHAHLVMLDRVAFGHDRSRLMQRLRERAQFAIIRDQGDVHAFATIRAFGLGFVVGPVVARNRAEAQALIQFLLAHHRGRFVRIDTDADTNLAGWLAERGLARVGGGIAMRRSLAGQKARELGHHRRYALVSQALG
jgi:GNAT superfamily N-acetyltransferase